MERVAFLIEPDGQRIGCMLNPEDVTVRRVAGIESREVRGGAIAGRGLSDDPLHFNGGGRTEVELSLLFDVDLPELVVTTADVRDLTRPLWRLSENALPADAVYGAPPILHFVWGKSWRIPAVVTAIAERLEAFTPEGVPRRSWLRLRLVRVPEPVVTQDPLPLLFPAPQLPDVLEPAAPALAADEPVVVVAAGSGPEHGERLDELARRLFGDPAQWRVLAYLNDLVDPLRVAAGTALRLPPMAPKDLP